MKLTKIAEIFIGEDSGAPFRERIAELEKDQKVLQSALSNLDEDYKLVAPGNRKLSLERDELKVCCDSLQAELSSAHSDAEKRISSLEAKVVSAEARSAEIAIESKKSLKDFQDILVQQLEQVHDMYAEKIQSISGLCLTVSAEKPSVEDYLNWLSKEVSGLPDVFSGVNENSAAAAIEGALTLASD
jgi:chromosome segregation ATPase